MSVAASNVNKIPINRHTPILALPKQQVFHPHVMLDFDVRSLPQKFRYLHASGINSTYRGSVEGFCDQLCLSVLWEIY